MTQSNDLTSRLRYSPLFQHLAPSVVESMLNSMSSERWRRYSKIFSPGDCAERFFIIIRGRIKISRLDENTGRELTLLLLGPGDAFNVASLLDGQPAMVAARTMDEVAALSAPMVLWRRWVDENLQFRRAADRYAAQQLRALTELAMGLSLHTTMCRLARLLLRQLDAELQGSRQAEVNDLSHEELASLIGSTRVVVSRLLASLKREGTIDTGGRSIAILNEHRMRQHARLAIIEPRRYCDLMVL